jgi:hypothetical protein
MLWPEAVMWIGMAWAVAVIAWAVAWCIICGDEADARRPRHVYCDCDGPGDDPEDDDVPDDDPPHVDMYGVDKDWARTPTARGADE